MSHPPRCEALVIGAFSDSTEGLFSSCYVMTNRGRCEVHVREVLADGGSGEGGFRLSVAGRQA
jgi:hypothetical protein